MTARINPELVSSLKRLRLGGLIETLIERLVLADKQDMSFEDFLLLILNDEIARRDSSAATRRAVAGDLDPNMRIELFDKTAKITCDKRVFNELASLRFIEKQKHVVVLGPVGVGKTFMATAIGHIACQHGCNARFARTDTMMRTLRQSRLDNSREQEMLTLTSVDLLILDDFALEPMNKEESRDIYQLFLERTGRASMILRPHDPANHMDPWGCKVAATAKSKNLDASGLTCRHSSSGHGEGQQPRGAA